MRHYAYFNRKTQEKILELCVSSLRILDGNEPAYIDIHVLGGKESEIVAPIRTIDLAPSFRLLKTYSSGYLFSGGKFLLVEDSEDDLWRWKAILVDPDLGALELEKMRRKQMQRKTRKDL